MLKMLMKMIFIMVLQLNLYLLVWEDIGGDYKNNLYYSSHILFNKYGFE